MSGTDSSQKKRLNQGKMEPSMAAIIAVKPIPARRSSQMTTITAARQIQVSRNSQIARILNGRHLVREKKSRSTSHKPHTSHTRATHKPQTSHKQATHEPLASHSRATHEPPTRHKRNKITHRLGKNNQTIQNRPFHNKPKPNQP